MIDYALIDPGIRETVRRLRDAGFNTSDSGDGQSKFMVMCECERDLDEACEHMPDGDTLRIPHVHMTCDPVDLVQQARHLMCILHVAGIKAEPMSPDGTSVSIEASYNPASPVAILSLFGVNDKTWEAS